MTSYITAGVLFLALCCVTHSSNVEELLKKAEELKIKFDAPPSNIEVERPIYPYSWGDYFVAMDERDRLELICTAEGTPEPTYRWEFNGGPLGDDPRISDVDGVLTVLEPTRDDEGDYQCFAANKHGTAMSPIYKAIFAYQLPFEDTGMIRESFEEGDEAILECGAPDGAPKPRIYWTDHIEFKTLDTDNRISYSTEGNLHFSNILESDEGGYYCFAANDLLGSYMRSALHNVRVNSGDGLPRPARISSLPTSVMGLRKEKFKIKCLASGFPTPVISWFKDGQELPGGDSSIALESHNQDLVFSSLGFDDAGTYECRASNDENTPPVFETVHLTVNSAPYFDPEPADLIVAPGDSSAIDCKVGGIPKPVSKWLQNGQEIRDSESSSYQVINSSRIAINSVREGESTVFQCIADNIYGTEVGSFTITVLAIPATISEGPLPSVTASEGTSFQLDCVTFGSPTPTVEWHKDGVKLDSGGRITITEENDGATSHLNVSDLALEDAGTYECHALNSVDNDMQSSVIFVRLPTSVTLTPETQNVIKGNRADFTCHVVADERVEPTIRWFFGDTELNPNQPGSEYELVGENVLRVLAAKASHTGTFRCLAETEHDEDSATAELIVQAEPNAPYGVRLEISGLEATLSWTEPASNNAEIQNYTIEYRTQHDTFPFPSDIAPWAKLRTVSASISEDTITLENYLEYSFRVTASNAIGTSEKSEVVTGDRTPPGDPDEDSMPSGVRSEATEPGTLTVSWDEVHPFHHNGPDFSYVVKWRKEGETDWREAVITDPSQTSFDITAEEYENIEYSVGVRNSVDDGPPPEQNSGTTGQGVPSAAPGNVKLEAISSNAINVSWDAVPEEDVNGELLHYKIYYTRQSQQGSTKTVDCPADQTSCVVDGLEAFSNYEVEVAVVNGHAEGPRSEAQTIRTEEGVPSPSKIKSVQATSYRIAVKWDPPAQENGVLLGYHLQILEIDKDSDTISNQKNVTTDNVDMLKYVVEDAKPETDYEIVLSAYTRVGDSTTEKAETKTAKPGAPVTPGKPVAAKGIKELNVTWPAPPEEGPLPDEVRACYKVKGSEDDCVYTDYVDVLETNHIMIDGLEEGTKYEVFLEFKNKDGTERGETEICATQGGPGKTSGEDGGFPSWFIALICIIIFLLLILLIICILKTQKGGKYNVSDKEKQLKDENAPLKNNDGFPEFNQDSEFPDDMDGSQDSLASNPEGSEGDSLKEYADDEDPSKFNEEGSFIEEYHDPKTRSTDVREGGTSTFV